MRNVEDAEDILQSLNFQLTIKHDFVGVLTDASVCNSELIVHKHQIVTILFGCDLKQFYLHFVSSSVVAEAVA